MEEWELEKIIENKNGIRRRNREVRNRRNIEENNSTEKMELGKIIKHMTGIFANVIINTQKRNKEDKDRRNIEENNWREKRKLVKRN